MVTSGRARIGGARELALLSTRAANHTKALADDHGFTSALIGGYQLAFIAGAVAIGTGIVLAFALLRTRDPGRGWRSPRARRAEGAPELPPNVDMEEAA